jgi:hypothetical protein
MYNQLKYISLFILISLTACAGRSATPVSSYKYGDERLSCADLRYEISRSETNVKKLVSEKNSAHEGNVALGVVGGLLFWPALFALDTSDAEKIEMQAEKERIESLQRIMAQKSCGHYKSTIADIDKPAKPLQKEDAASER